MPPGNAPEPEIKTREKVIRAKYLLAGGMPPGNAPDPEGKDR